MARRRGQGRYAGLFRFRVVQTGGPVDGGAGGPSRPGPPTPVRGGAHCRSREDAAQAAEIGAEKDQDAWIGHLYAFHLPAQFREPRAYPLVIRYARLPSDTLELIDGDFVTEGLAAVLAWV